MAGKTPWVPPSGGGGQSWFNRTFKPPSTKPAVNRQVNNGGNSIKQHWWGAGSMPDTARQYEQMVVGPSGNSGLYNRNEYNAWLQQMNSGQLPGTVPQQQRIGGGGGGGYGGGGGGGGGGNLLTQAMFDQMVAALSRQGPTLQSTPLNLPAFRGQNIAAFNNTPYTQAQQSLNQAVTADRANVATNAQQTTNALNQNFRNDYANQTVTPGVTSAPAGAALQATAGPVASNDANQQAAQGVNAANGDSQAAFSNLLNVLAANANQSQQSRLSQVAMDKGTALNQIGAQQLGLGATINQARANAQTQWQQQNNERQYQNSLMAQQWAREQAMQNNQMTNQTAQANWTQRNQQLASTLQPILDLIASTGGAKGINMSALTALLNRR